MKNMYGLLNSEAKSKQGLPWWTVCLQNKTWYPTLGEMAVCYQLGATYCDLTHDRFEIETTIQRIPSNGPEIQNG